MKIISIYIIYVALVPFNLIIIVKRNLICQIKILTVVSGNSFFKTLSCKKVDTLVMCLKI